MKRTFIAALLASTAAVAAAQGLSFNVSAVSDYRYRGISQTRLKPALQGGVDYALPSGLYVGTWASNIRWIKDAGTLGNFDAGSSNIEWDLYGGYKGEIQKDLGFDVGLLQYAYVGNKLADAFGGGVYKNANTTEIYGALTYGPVTGKLSYALTNLFGNYNFAEDKSSKGSYYFDLSGTFDLGSGFSAVPHIGYQKVAKIDNASYTDYSLTISKDLGSGFSVSGAIVGTDADKLFYASPVNGKFLGKTSGFVSVKYVF